MVIILVSAWTSVAQSTQPATRPKLQGYLLELCGIAGNKWIDRQVVRGIVAGGFNGNTASYDWTENDPGIHALLAMGRNKRQAKLIADGLAGEIRTRPHEPIYVLAHSGGTGLAVWALQDLPPGCQIDSMALMSSALSPTYDLTPALRHVRGHVYVFSSLTDLLVLGTGTSLFGTIDGVKTDAAGRVGFIMPPGADPKQYAKLVALPYDPSWTRYHNLGDHIGGMTAAFGKWVLAPLLLDNVMPPVRMSATTQTATGLGRQVVP